MEYHYIRWFPADYMRDTRRLTQCEHGAYFLLLNEYYLTGEPLPDDDRLLAKITLSDTLSEWSAIRSAVAQHFEIRDGKWFHHRCDEEIERAILDRSYKVKGAEATNAIRREKKEKERSASRRAIRSAQRSAMKPEPEPYPESELKPELEPLKSKTLVAAEQKSRSDSQPTPGKLVWISYERAIEERYGSKPPVSKQAASLCKQFAEKIPIEDAPLVAEYYVWWDQRVYVESGHCLELMCRDAMKLHVGWKSNKQTTSHQAREADRLNGVGTMWREIIDENCPKEIANE